MASVHTSGLVEQKLKKISAPYYGVAS